MNEEYDFGGDFRSKIVWLANNFRSGSPLRWSGLSEEYDFVMTYDLSVTITYDFEHAHEFIELILHRV